MWSAGFQKRLDRVTQKLKSVEIKELQKNQQSAQFDSRTASNMLLKDISIEKINRFLSEANIKLNITRRSLADFLESLKLFENRKLNNAAAMMFATDVGKHVFNCQIHLVAFFLPSFRRGQGRFFIKAYRPNCAGLSGNRGAFFPLFTLYNPNLPARC